MKHKFSKTTLSLIISGVLLIGSIVLYWSLYIGYQNTLERVSGLRSELALQTERNNELGLIEKNLSDTVSDYDRLDSIFVKDTAVVDFIQEIEGIGSDIGLAIETKSVEAKSVPSLEVYGKENLSITVNTVGNWRDTMQFISLIENLPYKVSFSNLSVVSDSAGEWEGVIGFDVIKKIAEDENK